MSKTKLSNPAILKLYREAIHLSRGEAISPWMAILHLTERCNHKCYWGDCEYANIRLSKHTRELSRDRALSLIDEISELRTLSILFSGGGEPMLHPSFSEAIERAKNHGLSVGVFSNGSLIEKRHLASAIVESATFIRVSVDAATPETFSLVRGVDGSGFEAVLCGVSALVAQRATRQVDMDISLKFLVSRINAQEIPDFVRRALDLNVDNVQFKPLRGGTHELDEPGFRRAQQMIDDAKRDHPGFITGGMADKRHDLMPCFLTPLRVVIDARGDVMLCNYFNHRRETHTFGNINESNLKEIWFGEQHRKALERGIDRGGCVCFDCRFHELNKELSLITTNDGKYYDFV